MFRLLILAVMEGFYTGLYFPVLETLTKQIKYIKLSILRKENTKKIKTCMQASGQSYRGDWFKQAIKKPSGIS